MPKFLVRDFSSPVGYSENKFPDRSVKLNLRDVFVPWALIPDRQEVIYARYGEHNGFNNTKGLVRYDSLVSHKRQRSCTSELGALALKCMSVMPAVNIVSYGVKEYLTNQAKTYDVAFKQKVFKDIAHYFYTNGGFGYGRISQLNKTNISIETIFNDIIKALEYGRLEQKQAIHDAVGRKLLYKDSFEKKTL